MPKVPKITSLQYLGNREVRDKFIFLHEDKHQRLFEGDTLAFGGHSQAFPERPKQEVCNTICYILRKKEGVKLFFFCMQISKPFYKLILSILVSMASDTQSTQNNKFPKSFQYLKKDIDEVGNIIFDVCGRTYRKYSKYQVCSIFTIT